MEIVNKRYSVDFSRDGEGGGRNISNQPTI